jgi:hypothetical protein
MTTGDIQAHLVEIYDTDISRDTISRITDAVVEDMVAWQHRPLDAVYPVIFIDALMVKIRDGQVANRPCTWRWASTWTANATCWGCGSAPPVAKAPSSDGAAHRAAQPWGQRHVHRLLRRIEGLPEAIRATWPVADVQLCVVSRAVVSGLHVKGSPSTTATACHHQTTCEPLPVTQEIGQSSVRVCSCTCPRLRRAWSETCGTLSRSDVR